MSIIYSNLYINNKKKSFNIVYTCFICIFLLSSFLSFSESIQTESMETLPENNEKISPIIISKFNIVENYYGFPLTVRLGYFFRYENFSVFPYVGIKFSASDFVNLTSFTGIELKYKYIGWRPEFHYEFFPLPSEETKKAKIYYFQNRIDFSFVLGGISSLSFYGKKTWTQQSTNNKVVVDTFSQGLLFNIFLIDIGFFRSTLSTFVNIDYVIPDSFLDYFIQFDVPLTFSLYHFDIAFRYAFFYTDYIKLPHKPAKNNYVIEKKYDSLTARINFKSDNPIYYLINSFDFESRWYFLRSMIPTSNFFISLFANIGFGFHETSTLSLIYQGGLGFGYTLLNVVPFTTQLGIDNNKNFILYIGVVSKIYHKP